MQNIRLKPSTQLCTWKQGAFIRQLAIWHQNKHGVKRNLRCPISDFLGTHVMLWSHPKQEQSLNAKAPNVGYSANSKAYQLINFPLGKSKSAMM
jgi:hypothetical protein